MVHASCPQVEDASSVITVLPAERGGKVTSVNRIAPPRAYKRVSVRATFWRIAPEMVQALRVGCQERAGSAYSLCKTMVVTLILSTTYIHYLNRFSGLL